MKRENIVWAIVTTFVFVVVVAVAFWLTRLPQGQSARIRVANTTSAATIACAADGGSVQVTSEIALLWTLDDLDILPSDEPFAGEWLYRIVFNPSSAVEGGDEITVLFGPENLSINGQTYVAAEGVDYADILSWAEGKYQYFARERVS